MLGRLVHPPHPATVAQPRQAFGVAGPLPPHPASVGRNTSALPTVQRTIAPHPAKASILRSVAQRSAASTNAKEAAIKEAAAAADVKTVNGIPIDALESFLSFDFSAPVRDDSAHANSIDFRSLIVVHELDVLVKEPERYAGSLTAQTGRIRILADVTVIPRAAVPADVQIEMGFVQAMNTMKIELVWGDGSLSLEHRAADGPLMDTNSTAPPAHYPFYDKKETYDETAEHKSYLKRNGGGVMGVWLEDQPGMPIEFTSRADHLKKFGHIRWTQTPPVAAAASKRLVRATANYSFDTWLVAKVGGVYIILGKVSWTSGFTVTLVRVEQSGEGFLAMELPVYSLQQEVSAEAVASTKIPDSVLVAQKSAYDTYFRK